MATQLNLGRDNNTNVTFELPWTGEYYETTLAATVAQSLTVPPNSRSVYFSFQPGLNVFVKLNGSPIALPTGAFANVPNKAFGPTARHSVKSGDTLQFICDTNAFVSVEFFDKCGSVA